MVFDVIGKDNLNILDPNFSPFFHLHCYSQVASFFTFISDQSAQHLFSQMPSLNLYEKFTCENCGTQTTKVNHARHKKSCSAGTLICTICPNFSTNTKRSESPYCSKA